MRWVLLPLSGEICLAATVQANCSAEGGKVHTVDLGLLCVKERGKAMVVSHELTSGLLASFQPNYELLDKEVEKRKMALQEAKLKAKGLNPDGTPALSTMGGFSPASKPCEFSRASSVLAYTALFMSSS